MFKTYLKVISVVVTSQEQCTFWHLASFFQRFLQVLNIIRKFENCMCAHLKCWLVLYRTKVHIKKISLTGCFTRSYLTFGSYTATTSRKYTQVK